MSVREKYKVSALKREIEEFSALISDKNFDAAVAFFRAYLDKPTLYGLETSFLRAAFLQKIEVDKLSDEKDKCFVLYSLALTLNLTGGFPNRAVPLYEKHDALAEKLGDEVSLCQSLGHHAKALRQIGRFFLSEQIALRGLAIIRRRGDFLREAVNLYWLGMGLAHRGEAELSEVALKRSLRIFRAKFAAQSEGVVSAFLAQRALWLGFYDEALDFADRAIEIGEKLKNDRSHADLHGAVKILTAALRMKGEASIYKAQTFAESDRLLQSALKLAEMIEFVEEELPALRALALKSLQENDLTRARNLLQKTWHLAERGEFLLYNADSYNILAQVELSAGHHHKAVEAARKALALSVCDGPPFAYQRGLEDAQNLLKLLNTESYEIPKFSAEKFLQLSVSEINPSDEFEN